MARPRSDAEGPTARERIVAAFWEMLSEGSYADIKVTALAQRARVSPNTLYYHFDGVLDVARSALGKCLDPELTSATTLAEAGALAEIAGAGAERAERLVAFARSGSAELTGMLSETLRSHWLAYVGVGEEDLDEGQRSDLAFAFGGAVAMLADPSFGASPRDFTSFFERPLGRGASEMMHGLTTDTK